MTLRYLTAGESHGPALTAIVEGFPAGLSIQSSDLSIELERRRLGYGRSPRMNFEQDKLEILGGVRHGRTMGSPVAVVIHNSEWPRWTAAMSPDPVDNPDEVSASARGQRLTRPRPGHADLVAALKYEYDDVRDALERASARETAARVVVGTIAKALLAEVGVTIVSHVVAIGGVAADDAELVRPGPDDLDAVDADPVRAFDAGLSARLRKRIDEAVADRDTLGGVIEVLAYGVPVGLGSHVHFDRKLDTRLAGAMMSVQAMKGVEVGDGFVTASRPGSAAHDEIAYRDGGFVRSTNRAGGLEAGMTNGQPVRVRVAMKPLSSLMRPLDTVDLETKETAEAITQRSDVCAVPRAGVVLESIMAIELANALLEKTGGDTVNEVRANLDAYLARVATR